MDQERESGFDAATWQQGRLVLVVDDDPDLREFLRETLEGADYRVKTAADGARALSAIASEVPDAVLLDIRMPRVSGDEVLSVLSKLKGHTPPVILMTAAERAREEARVWKNPYYLAKPFDEATLFATLETALDEAE